MKMSYLDKKILSLKIKDFIFFLFLILIVAICFYSLFKTRNFITPATISALIFVAIGYFLYPFLKKLDKRVGSFTDKNLKEINQFEQGKEGEEIVAKELQSILKNGLIIRNFIIPETKCEIDIISVSPRGLLFFEVKNYSRTMFFDPDKVLIKSEDKQTLIPLPKEYDPRRQLRNQYYTLKKYLESKGFGNIKIFNAIVFPKKFSADIQRNTGVIIIVGTEYLRKRINQMPDDPMFNSEFINKLANIF